MFVGTVFMGFCPFSGVVVPEDISSSLCRTVPLGDRRDAVQLQKRLSQRTQSRHVPSSLGWTKRSGSSTCTERLKTP
jgi:hypothetical protein